jgi:hypothetical protein
VNAHYTTRDGDAATTLLGFRASNRSKTAHAVHQLRRQRQRASTSTAAHSEQAMVDIPKRNLLLKLSTALLALPAALTFARTPTPQQAQSPSLPGQDTTPRNAPGTPDPPALTDPKAMLKEHQQKIHDDVEKLYALAGDLKDEVEKTQTEHVLSLPMIQKAEQIEKLAKQIKTFARGD